MLSPSIRPYPSVCKRIIVAGAIDALARALVTLVEVVAERRTEAIHTYIFKRPRHHTAKCTTALQQRQRRRQPQTATNQHTQRRRLINREHAHASRFVDSPPNFRRLLNARAELCFSKRPVLRCCAFVLIQFDSILGRRMRVRDPFDWHYFEALAAVTTRLISSSNQQQRTCVSLVSVHSAKTG